MLHRARGAKIGKGVFIGDEVYIDNEYPECIEIQDNAAVSIRTLIIAHTLGPGKVIIGKGAYIGAHAVIACSAGRVLTIGEGAVIGAGCVVSRSVPPHVVLMPPPALVAGQATIPLTSARTMEEFLSGLRPLKLRKTPSNIEDRQPVRPG